MTPTGHWGEESRKGSFPGRNEKIAVEEMESMKRIEILGMG